MRTLRTLSDRMNHLGVGADSRGEYAHALAREFFGAELSFVNSSPTVLINACPLPVLGNTRATPACVAANVVSGES